MNVGRTGEQSCGAGPRERKRARDKTARLNRKVDTARGSYLSWVAVRGGGVGCFLLARRVRLRGNAVWTGHGWVGSHGRMGTALLLAERDGPSSSGVSAGAGSWLSVTRERIASRSAAGLADALAVSRQLLLPTATELGFRGSIARSGYGKKILFFRAVSTSTCVLD